MSISIINAAAHTGTARLGIREIVRQLNTSLGATLVSSLAGSRDRRISYKWARVDGPEPKGEAQARLLQAHRVWTLVASSEGEHVARLWFIGANPWLGEDTPIDAIREDRFKDAMGAALAMAEDQFAG